MQPRPGVHRRRPPRPGVDRVGARRLRVIGTVAGLVVGAVVGAGVTAQAITPPNSGITLSGVVTSAAGGAPIAGATVEVLPDVDLTVSELIAGLFDSGFGTSAVTNSEGAYTVDHGLLPYTAYSVCFLTKHGSEEPATGYVDRCYGDDASDKDTQTSQPVVFEPRQHRTGFDAALAVGAEISGTVTDADGHPLKDVGVGFGANFFTTASSVLADGSEYGALDSTGDGFVVYGICDVCSLPRVGIVKTDSAGHFILKGVAPGPWTTLDFDPSIAVGGDSTTGYLDSVYQHASDRATPIALTAGQHVTITTSVADAPAPPSGAISGTVRNVHGTPISDVRVAATYSTGPLQDSLDVASATTDSSGHYTIGGLANGGYSVCLSPNPTEAGTGTGAIGCHTQTNVKIAEGDVRTGIDIVATAGARISGHVTDKHANGLGGVQVVVEPNLQSQELSLLGGGTVSSGAPVEAITTPGGGYSISGLAPGAYSVCFDASTARGPSPVGYAGECYNKETDPFSADPVTLGSGQSTTINASLADLATLPSVSGRVTDAHGNPIGDVGLEITVSHQPDSGDGYDDGNIITAPDGDFSDQGVPAGTYYVCAYGAGTQGGSSAGGYADKCGKSGRITVTVSKKSVTGVDFALAAAGAVSGVVTDGSGDPVPGAEVEIFRSSSRNPFNSVASRADGSYSFDGLANGSYGICVNAVQASETEGPASGLAPTCAGNIAWNLTSQPATNLAVLAGKDTVVPPIHLGVGAAIAGRLTDTDGDPLAGVEVDINPLKSSDDGSFNSTTTAPDGSYLMTGLSPGVKYDVCFSTDNGSGGPSPTGYASTCHGGAPYSEDGDGTGGTAIKTIAGTTTINQDLPDGAEITGKVVDADGSPVAGASIEISEVSPFGVSENGPSAIETYDDGTYGLAGLEAGTYDICFEGGTSSDTDELGLIGQCYKNKSLSSQDLTSVTVTLGQHLSNVNATFTFAGGVSGHVLDQHGKPAAGVPVLVGPGGLEGIEVGAPAVGITDSKGNYEVTGVTPGKDITACFLAPTEDGSTCYKNKPVESPFPTTFTVVAGKVTTGIDGTVKL